MALVVSNRGKRGLAGVLPPYLAGLFLGLFGNDWTPSAAAGNDVPVQPVFPGYRLQALPVWMGPYEAGGAMPVAELQAATVVWKATGVPLTPQKIYGYIVVDVLGNWVWAERNPAGPVTIKKAGDVFSVLPRLDCTNVGG